MKKYEYKIISSDSSLHLEEKLNKLGKNGWEVVEFQCVVIVSCTYICILKRELES